MKRYLLLIVVVTLCVVSCSRYEESLSLQSSGDGVTFTAALNTRVEAEAFEKGDDISIAAFEGSAEYATNVKYSYSGSLFSCDSPIEYNEEDESQQLSFCAVYPSVSGSVTEFNFAIEENQSGSGYEMSDLLVASTEATSQRVPELLFSHKMSGIVMNIISSSSIDGATLTYSAKSQVACDLIEGSYTAYGDATQIIANAATTSSFEVILAPQTLSAGVEVATFEIGSKSYTWRLDDAIILKSGMRYTLYWDLASNSVIYSGEYEDWEDSGSEETVVPKANYMTVPELAGDAGVWGETTYPVKNMWDGTYYIETSHSFYHSDEDAIGKCVTFSLGLELDLTSFMLYPRGGTGRFFSGHSLKNFNIYGAAELTDEMYAVEGDTPDFTGWSPILMGACCEIPSGSASASQDDLDYIQTYGHIFEVESDVVSARYIRIQALDSWGGTECFHIGEVDFWGHLVTADEDITYTPDEDGVIRVGSLEEMQPLLKMSNVSVELEQNTYRITAMDIVNGKYSNYAEVVAEGSYTHSIFLVEGSNSTYDFNGSTVIIETDAFDVSGYEFFPLHFIGNGNIVKNLTQIDEGEAEAIHANGVTNVVMDGSYNTLEGVTVHAKGSYPYGYGELFGKGGGPVIKHYKHCGVLVRGNYNTVEACSLYNKVFGHGIFMQAAENVTITDCYVEGAMKTTNEVLAEAGTGSAADLVDFMTDWDYTVPADFTFSLMEDGVRIYDAGNTMINGIRYSRGSTSISVTGCYVKSAREGIVLDGVGGTSVVEDCTAVGCDLNFSISSGHILRSFADCQYGPAYEVAHNFNSLTIDITLLPNEGDNYINGYWADNGSRSVCNIYGYNNNITFKADASLTDDLVNKNYWINFGGKNNRIGSQEDWEDRYEHVGHDNYLRNETSFPIFLAGYKSDGTTKMSYDNVIETAGEVTYEDDSQSLNSVTYIPFGGDDN